MLARAAAGSVPAAPYSPSFSAASSHSSSVSYTHLDVYKRQEDEFATLFRQMLTVEQYRTPELGALYRRCLLYTSRCV